jgi:hypothetical protein
MSPVEQFPYRDRKSPVPSMRSDAQETPSEGRGVTYSSLLGAAGDSIVTTFTGQAGWDAEFDSRDHFHDPRAEHRRLGADRAPLTLPTEG